MIMSNFRLLQMVVFAGACLLLLKSTALIFSESKVLTGQVPLNAQEAQNKQPEPDENKDKEETKVAANTKKSLPEDKASPEKTDDVIKEMKPVDYSRSKVVPSNSELDLLESLAKRRKQLNVRETQLKLKENLLKAAQRQIDERIKTLKDLEAKIQVDLKKQDVMQQGQYKRLVKIYSSMKPKEAARIFDGLDMTILVDLMRAMKAASGSQILAKMKPEKARSLTILLARQEQKMNLPKKQATADLPKITDEKPAAENK